MGNRTSCLEIDSSEYQCGSIIEGIFWMKISDPEEITDVSVTLNEIDKTTIQVLKPIKIRQYDPDYEDKDLVKIVPINKINLLTRPIEHFLDGTDGSKFIYKWNFSMEVPDCAPSMSLRVANANIKYILVAEAVKKSMLKFNIRESKNIKITRKWDPVPNNPYTISINKDGINASFILETKSFFYGKNYNIHIIIDNKSKLVIKKFFVEILRDGYYVCANDRYRMDNDNILGKYPCIINTELKKNIGPGEKDEFDMALRMPDNGIPSLHSELIWIKYLLQVGIKTDEIFFSNYTSEKYKINVLM